MTRINCGIPPETLTDQHLLAEHREIKRMPTYYQKWLSTKSPVPAKFSLNKGHMVFFVDKGKYTLERYLSLHKECLRRGFSVQDYSGNWDSYLGTKEFSDYQETGEETNILKERLVERINQSTQQPLFWGSKVEKNFYDQL